MMAFEVISYIMVNFIPRINSKRNVRLTNSRTWQVFASFYVHKVWHQNNELIYHHTPQETIVIANGVDWAVNIEPTIFFDARAYHLWMSVTTRICGDFL